MTEIVAGPEGPHADSPVHAAGTPPEAATAAVLAFHGRGVTPASVLGIAREVDIDVDGVAYLAPAASRNTWYPRSFTEPLDANESHLGSALDLADDLVGRAADRVGRERVALLGFSQGACLAGEYVARNAARHGGLAVLSGSSAPKVPRETMTGVCRGRPPSSAAATSTRTSLWNGSTGPSGRCVR